MSVCLSFLSSVCLCDVGISVGPLGETTGQLVPSAREQRRGGERHRAASASLSPASPSLSRPAPLPLCGTAEPGSHETAAGRGK